MHLGAHVSVAGGLEFGPRNGQTLGAEVIQIFTRNQRTWQHPPLHDAEVAAFREARDKAGIRTVVSHGSYLLNLAAVDRRVKQRSIRALAAEIDRCRRLGVEVLVFHPGAHGGQGEATGIDAVAQSLDRAVEASGGVDGVCLALETTAGQGQSVGHRFEHLRDILARVKEPELYGVCLDTCHVFTAGYDLRSRAAYEATLETFDRVIGLERLVALHLNDSLRPLNSRRDRHADLGEGELGIRVFTRMVRDARFQSLPGVLETPGGMDVWKRELTRLKRARRRR